MIMALVVVIVTVLVMVMATVALLGMARPILRSIYPQLSDPNAATLTLNLINNANFADPGHGSSVTLCWRQPIDPKQLWEEHHCNLAAQIRKSGGVP